MGVSIQFESDRVEFWAIYTMERDDDVLEFYEQSSRIPLSYRAKSGYRTTQWHTPDFFVLRRGSAGWEEWKEASSLDILAEEKPARYQLAGTGQWHCPPGEAYAEQFGFRNTSGQLARRGRDIHFARYHAENKEERTAFVAALKYLLERVPLDVDVNALLSRWRWWASGCAGRIGILKDWLVDAVAATLVQNGTSLTEEILTRTMPHPARRLSLEMEARAGERKVALHDSESAKQFQALVKKPANSANGKTAPMPGSMPGVPYAGQANEIVEHARRTLPLPQVAPKPTKQRVGQRAPERDPVGETSAPSVRQAIGCPFTEAILVTPSQMEEARVSLFEGPTCLAVRDITPKGNRVKFPWHPRRKTTTPNQGLR